MKGARALLIAAALVGAAAAGAFASTPSVEAVSLPILYAPAGNIFINTPRPTVAWQTAWPDDPLVAFKVRISTNDSAYGMVIYDSGWISGSTPIYTLTYTPPTNVHLYAFVWEKHEIGGEIGWSPNQNGGFTISTSMPGPSPVTSFVATPGDHQITLAWHNPSSASFTGTMIRYKTTGCPVSPTDGTLVVDRPAAPGTDDSYVHSGLSGGLTYYYSAFAHDAVPNYATQLYACASPMAPDTVPPGPVAAFHAIKGSGRNVLSWRNPDDADFAGTMVRYKTTGYPTGPTDGTLLVDRAASRSTADSYVHSGTSPALTYYYAVFAHDGIPNYAAAAQATAIELPQVGLRIHPENPHYFQDAASGRAVMITGYTSIVPSALDFDYVAGLAELASRRVSYSRVWHFLPWSLGNAIWPWGRSSTPGAPMGGNKIDMNTWNGTYWTRMRDALVTAYEGGTVGEIHLFDRCGMSPAEYTRWHGNPWASDNNVNNLETPLASSDGTPEFYQWSSRPNLKSQQERYVRKMIDETIIYPNVIYEVENEHWDASSTGWADHYAQFVKDYITANYPSSQRLVSYSSILSTADLDACYSMPALDIINRHWGSSSGSLNDYIESRWGYNKAINIDEFANGLADPATLRDLCWTIVTSGGNFHIEDCGSAARPFDVVENIRSFLALSGWDFVHAAPNKGLIAYGGGYCMAQPGVEYVCYFPIGGSKTVTLAAGDYRVEWWSPVSGGFYGVSSISTSGGSRTLATPDAGQWVLHLTTREAPATVLEAKQAGEIAIDGSPSDWNLPLWGGISNPAQGTEIKAGDVGTGDVALVGYDANGICYQGNHAAWGQYPPADAADHTARVYSLSDDNHLYFLIRCDDSDIRCPNPVEANCLNDCVEIYIDPGHDGGSASMSNSTSDVELVIDANNQKNVYGTTPAYGAAVLAGVSSAVVRDSTGWWLEARISKAALDPDIPSSGDIGIDFCFCDNDNDGDTSKTTVYTWRDSSSDGFPSKVPDRWGDLSMPVVLPPFGPLQAKALPDGAELTMTTGVVSAVFGDSFYVQCPYPEPTEEPECGLCGIKVVPVDYGLQIGQPVSVQGTLLTDPATGERYISAGWVR